MRIEYDSLLAPHTTLRVGGLAKLCITIATASEIPDAVVRARTAGLAITVMGGGSNMLVHDESINRCIMLMTTRGIDVVEENDVFVLVRSASGEAWGSLVAWAIEHNVWGIENLAGIPGTVGATPVQNVGAYGVEVAQIIASVEVFDMETMSFAVLLPEQCAFGYRDSIFKHAEGERYIITSVTMKLLKQGTPSIGYKDIADYFGTTDTTTLQPRDIADAVVHIRAGKFPDMTRVGTAGSFFKNPVVPIHIYRALGERFPDMPGHDGPDGIKLSLAWILDHVCHLKGHRVGNVALFEKQPLVLVAHDGATAHEIDMFARDVAQRVCDATQIAIEREVREIK